MLKKMLVYFTNLWYAIDIKVKNGRCKMKEFWEKATILFGHRNKVNHRTYENELTVVDIAEYFSSFENMTHKKLQKLVYYAYAWYIALYNERADNIVNRLCVDTQFEAWVHGPVCRTLYNLCSDNYGMVPKYEGNLNPLITGEIKKFLDDIYKIFGKYTGNDLEYMTHNEMPWQNARDNLPASAPSRKTISESDMFTYYNSL